MVSLLSELEARRLAAHVGGEIHRFAVVTKLCTASVPQMDVQRRLACDCPAGTGLGQALNSTRPSASVTRVQQSAVKRNSS